MASFVCRLVAHPRPPLPPLYRPPQFFILFLVVCAEPVSMGKVAEMRRRHCYTCGMKVSSRGFISIGRSSDGHKPGWCNGGEDCCAFTVASTSVLGSCPLHTHAAHYSSYTPGATLRQIQPVSPPDRVGWNVCFECAEHNKTVTAEMQHEYELEQAQTQNPLQRQHNTASMLLVAGLVNASVAASTATQARAFGTEIQPRPQQVLVNDSGAASGLQQQPGLRRSHRRNASSVSGIDLATFDPPDLPEKPSEKPLATSPATSTPQQLPATDGATSAGSGGSTAAPEAVPVVAPTVGPGPVAEPTVAPPPAAAYTGGRTTFPVWERWGDTLPAPEELVLYRILGGHFSDSGLTMKRARGSSSSAFFASAAALFSEIAGLNGSDSEYSLTPRQLAYFVSTINKSTGVHSRKRSNIFARQTAIFAASAPGAHLLELASMPQVSMALFRSCFTWVRCICGVSRAGCGHGVTCTIWAA